MPSHCTLAGERSILWERRRRRVDRRSELSGELLGGVAVFFAALLGGATGFGYALLSAPLLLLLGFPLRFVVSANLALAFLTRISVVYRFRRHICTSRAVMLVLGSLPGLFLGLRTLQSVDPSHIKFATGVLVMIAALLLLRAVREKPPRPVPGAPLVAGLAGGFLGATTSLSGISPALLLARDKAAPESFQADLAVYFVASNAVGLTMFAADGTLVREALIPTALLWLPGALLGNFIGATLSTRLPDAIFRYLTLAVALVSGAVTALTA